MRMLLLSCLLFSSTFLLAQGFGAVKGTVLDAEMNNDPLFFARIEVKGTALGAETNFHGNFEIDKIEPGSYTLVISYLGYESLETPIIIDDKKVIFIQKELHAKRLDPAETSASAKATSALTSERETAIRP